MNSKLLPLNPLTKILGKEMKSFRTIFPVTKHLTSEMIQNLEEILDKEPKYARATLDQHNFDNCIIRSVVSKYFFSLENLGYILRETKEFGLLLFEFSNLVSPYVKSFKYVHTYRDQKRTAIIKGAEIPQMIKSIIQNGLIFTNDANVLYQILTGKVVSSTPNSSSSTKFLDVSRDKSGELTFDSGSRYRGLVHLGSIKSNFLNHWKLLDEIGKYEGFEYLAQKHVQIETFDMLHVGEQLSVENFCGYLMAKDIMSAKDYRQRQDQEYQRNVSLVKSNNTDWDNINNSNEDYDENNSSKEGNDDSDSYIETEEEPSESEIDLDALERYLKERREREEREEHLKATQSMGEIEKVTNMMSKSSVSDKNQDQFKNPNIAFRDIFKPKTTVRTSRKPTVTQESTRKTTRIPAPKTRNVVYHRRKDISESGDLGTNQINPSTNRRPPDQRQQIERSREYTNRAASRKDVQVIDSNAPFRREIPNNSDPQKVRVMNMSNKEALRIFSEQDNLDDSMLTERQGNIMKVLYFSKTGFNKNYINFRLYGNNFDNSAELEEDLRTLIYKDLIFMKSNGKYYFTRLGATMKLRKMDYSSLLLENDLPVKLRGKSDFVRHNDLDLSNAEVFSSLI